jgi:hypothetical protein
MSISNRIRKCFGKLDWTGSPYEIAETSGGYYGVTSDEDCIYESDSPEDAINKCIDYCKKNNLEYVIKSDSSNISNKSFSESNNETRIYEISGHKSDLDNLEKALAFISWSCGVGHSDSVRISFDGDGYANISIKRDDEPLDESIKSKFDCSKFRDSGHELKVSLS